MKTVLHIGMAKTGSTTLQNCMKQSRRTLAQSGILYPRNHEGCHFNNHRMLVVGYTPAWKLPRHMRRIADNSKGDRSRAYRSFLDAIQAQIARQSPAVMVLSSETLFRVPNARMRAILRAALPDRGDGVEVAAYLRRPSAYFLSNLQQALKHSHVIRPIKTPWMHRVLDGYAEIFGPDAVKPRLFERTAMKDGDIISDFLSAWLPECGVDPAGLAQPEKTNTSLSAEAMDLTRLYRQAFHAKTDNLITPDSVELVRALEQADRAANAGPPNLRPEVAERIDYRTPDPLHIRDRYGLEFSGLDYGKLEKTRFSPLEMSGLGPWLRRRQRLEDLVSINRQTRHDVLEHLNRSDWTTASPDRKAWVESLIRETR